MTTAGDPFDFGLSFRPMSERIVDERKRRRVMAEAQMPFNIGFLDDCLRSIMPHDLILIGARTGAGKTELARWIAQQAAGVSKKRVRYFALEAEADELERRTKFSVLSKLIRSAKLELSDATGRKIPFNYPDWYRCRFESQIEAFDARADELIKSELATLQTYYRGPKFDHDDVRRIMLAEQTGTDLFVLDHLHYVDVVDENENRGVREVIMAIRNTALLIGKPVIVVVHLRKRTPGSRALVPTADEIMGSSDIAKVCTHAIMIEPAYSVPATTKVVNNTFFSVAKDRGDGAKNLIALCQFNWITKCYSDAYTLGRENRGTFEPLGTSEVPYWAARHEPLSVPIGGEAA